MYVDNDLACALPDGNPWPPDALSSSFRYLVKRAGMPGVRFHDLRHSHATQLMRGGTNPKIVSERL
ncbi:MAG: tyrosine-type recombinase/integrase [bacterium]